MSASVRSKLTNLPTTTPAQLSCGPCTPPRAAGGQPCSTSWLRLTPTTAGLLVAVAVVVFAAFLVAAGDASSVGFDLHHRFSPVVRQWAEARGHPFAAQEWPARGSLKYYSALSRHDRAHLARRVLAGGADDRLLTFAAGNDTLQYIGSLYYAEVEVGTPNATFIVALDTGSDLFWVPCDCKQCASIANFTGQPESATGLRPYSPRQSSTSKQVTCDNALCDAARRNNTAASCGAATNGSCPYEVRYVSANTSTSGVLVEDVLHLTREGPGAAGAGEAAEALQAPIVFGCGQVQTGSFLDGGAFDGLMGLGRAKVSVPSALAAAGLVASDSFSMCFGDGDRVGRINFGDAGSQGQAETPFEFTGRSTLYNVSFTSVNVGNESVAAEFAAVVDSGTSFTYLSDPEYMELATSFNSQVRERRANFSSGSDADAFPFEYCYSVSPDQTEVLIPVVSLTTKGGALFPVTRPIFGLVDSDTRRALGYCLAILKNDLGINVNIIGQNFMTGLKVVFDRERSVLGWEKFDCYKNARVADAPDGSPSPAPEAGPTKITPRQNNGGSNGYPGATPLPRSTGSRNAGALGVGGLYLLLFLAAALV